MRRFCQIALVMAVAAMVAQSVSAQPPGQGGRRGGRGGFGGGMMGGGGVVMLLSNESVQKELKLDPDQVTKAKDAVAKVREQHQGEFAKLRELDPEERRTKGQELAKTMSTDALKAVDSILSKDQLARLKQIELQVAGANAFSRDDVGDALKLTADQKSKIKTILEDARKEMREAFQGGGGGGPGRFAEMQKQTTEKAVAVLTDDQKKTWKEMTGEPFQIQMQFGPGGPGGGRRGPRTPPSDKG